MYKIFNGSYYLFFETYEDLINWLAQHNVKCGTEISNSFLSHTGNNNNDICISHTFSYPSEYRRYEEQRVYRILDENDNSIYDSLLVKDVTNWTYDREKLNITGSSRKYKPSKWSRKWGSITYPEFRRGPWPHIHKLHGWKIYRRVHLFNEKRQCADPEYIKFNRGSRGLSLPDPWDTEPMRDIGDRGWKSQGRNRHQWELGVKTKTRHKYGKHTYVVKRNDKRNANNFYDGMDDLFDELG